jgi:ubiquinone/menaquinone biosynthesis C-methylase UbiE
LRGRRILELAHGPGHLLAALKQAGYEPVGIDLSPRMGRQAARRLRRAGLDAPLVRCRAEALPFRSGVFDAAVATFPTNFILDPLTLRDIARVTNQRSWSLSPPPAWAGAGRCRSGRWTLPNHRPK